MSWQIKLGAVLVAGWAAVVSASPVPSMALGGGQVLNIQNVVWADPIHQSIDTSTVFFAVDFSHNAPAGPTLAWEYHFGGTQYLSDMITAVAAADSSFTYVPDPAYGMSFIDNFNYGTNTGSANYNGVTNPTGNIYWSNWFGPYEAAGQSVNWQYAPWGDTLLQLGYAYDAYGDIGAAQDNMFYGYTINDYSGDSVAPILPTVAVPEPASLALIGGAVMLGLLKRRSHGRA